MIEHRTSEHHCRHCCAQSSHADGHYPTARPARPDEGGCYVSHQHTDVILIDTGLFLFRICRSCLQKVNDAVRPHVRKPAPEKTKR